MLNPRIPGLWQLPAALRGGDVQENKFSSTSRWGTQAQQDVVALNAALALRLEV